MYEDIVGKTLEEANKIYPGKWIRVVVNNGEHYFVTADWRPHRINVEVRDNKIVRIVKLG